MAEHKSIARMLSLGPTLSFEVMPPRGKTGTAALRFTLDVIGSCKASFVSITYGAGGSSRDKTVEVVKSITDSGVTIPMAHLSCIGHSKIEVDQLLKRYKALGLNNILALYGDAPRSMPDFVPTKDFSNAIDLVHAVRAQGSFDVAVALHPTGHPRASSWEEDIAHQARKLQEADFGITQFFFEVETYERFVECIRSTGVEKPIIPGILAPVNVKQLSRLEELSQTTIPNWVRESLETAEDQQLRGMQMAVDLSRQLMKKGAPGLHFYTMNSPLLASQFCTMLGLDKWG